MKVAKWGNSLAVRLPRAHIEALGLREGDEVEIPPEAIRKVASNAMIPRKLSGFGTKAPFHIIRFTGARACPSGDLQWNTLCPRQLQRRRTRRRQSCCPVQVHAVLRRIPRA